MQKEEGPSYYVSLSERMNSVQEGRTMKLYHYTGALLQLWSLIHLKDWKEKLDTQFAGGPIVADPWSEWGISPTKGERDGERGRDQMTKSGAQVTSRDVKRKKMQTFSSVDKYLPVHKIRHIRQVVNRLKGKRTTPRIIAVPPYIGVSIPWRRSNSGTWRRMLVQKPWEAQPFFSKARRNIYRVNKRV